MASNEEDVIGAISKKRRRTGESSAGDSNRNIQQDMLLQDDFDRLGQSGFRNATKVKFLAHQQGGSHAPSGSDSATDEAPANESQLDRKRRLNRNNERKKRAKKVLKIEELTSQFHDLTNQNENLKTESKALQERIALVKQYMKERADKKPAANNGGAAATAVTAEQIAASMLASSTGGGLLEARRWIAASEFASRIQNGAINTAGIPQATSALPHPTSSISPPPSSATQVASTASVASSLQTVASSSPHAAAPPTAAARQIDLSFLPREQRIRLLQHEMEKQNRILSLIRLHNATLGAPLQVNDRPPNVDPHNHAATVLSRVLGAPVTVSAATAPTQPNPLFSMAPANTGGILSNNTNVNRQSLQQQTTYGALSDIDRFLLQHQLLAALQNMQGDNRNGGPS